ncbi:hypothetical protein ACFL47_07770 [Candidatus Latescibacterota bacterium]
MMKKVVALYLSVYLVVGGFAFARGVHAQDSDTSYTLAVLDLTANGVSEVEARGLSDKLRSHISNLMQQGENLKAKYELIERSQMDKIFDEFEIQATGCVSDSCAVEFGKMLQADRMVIGSVSLVGSTYSISARIIETENSRMVGSSNKELRGSIDDVLTITIPEVGNDLILVPQKKSRLLWYVLGAVVVGGAGAGAALSGGGGGGEEPVIELLPTPPGRP